jgi:di/tricarboxylate transporter
MNELTAATGAPGPHAIAVMVLTVIALVLFTRDRLPLELTSLGLLAVLLVGFALFPYPGLGPTDLLSGFGHEALIAVCALMVVGQGLVHTGALEPVGRFLSNHWSKAPFLSFLATLLVAAVLSAFVNNTPIVVLLLPILISVCIRTGTSASGVLMPMAFATIVGGMATTIGTSTNLLVVSVADDLGLTRFGMFDFVLPASVAGGVAMLYLWLIAPHLLPKVQIALENPSPRLFEARLQLEPSSPAVGKNLADVKSLVGENMQVTRIRRGDNYIMPLPDVVLKAGDRLRIRDTPQRLKSFEEALKGKLYSDDQPVDDEHPLRAENQMLAELAVVEGSSVDRTNLRFARFLDRYQLAVLALHRAGRDIWQPREEIHDVILRRGDVLLVQGSRDQIDAIKESTEFLVLDASVTLPTTSKAPIALLTLAVVVVLAASGIMPIAVSAVAGAVVLVTTRTLNLASALRAISPSVFFVVVASLALGAALIATGATAYVTQLFLDLTRGAGPTVVLSALMLLLAILTNVVSNNAVAVIGTPIAVSIAAQLGLPAEPFVLAVLFGANMSYATPMAYQTNLLVMSAAKYRFKDFLRVGIPLTLLMWITLTWVLSTLYF